MICFKNLILLLLGLGFFFLPQLHSTEKWRSFETLPPIGVLYHPVSTNNRDAQRYFDEGLTNIYAFNRDAAYRAFEKAAESDPQLAMAYWGMALALGQTINRDVTLENQKKAFKLINTAMKLSSQATENEQAYIKALATRYSGAPNPNEMDLRVNYKNAMEKVYKTYQEDLDAATLYAESIMNVHPWRYWTNEGDPESGTLKVIAILESVMKRDPLHIGANHLYIHVTEESKYPERALMSAQRLKNILPEAGHILHMPSHVYLRVGDYEQAVIANKKAVAADRRYIEKYGVEGFYPLHYLSHNFYFLTRAYMWSEQYEEAKETASQLTAFYLPHWERMPHLVYYALAPMQVLLYFHRWEEILQLPAPDPKMKSLKVFWHFSRALAYASLGDLAQEKKEHALFVKQKGELDKGKEESYVGWEFLGSNTSAKVLGIAESLLNAKLAEANQQRDKQIAFLLKAIEQQDGLNYNEPPDWYYPIRQTLGALLLEEKRYQEAEHVFREALKNLPQNGRSLFGLWTSLKAQNKATNAYWVEREMNTALRYRKKPLRIKDL